jgi:hypothetical protein
LFFCTDAGCRAEPDGEAAREPAVQPAYARGAPGGEWRTDPGLVDVHVTSERIGVYPSSGEAYAAKTKEWVVRALALSRAKQVPFCSGLAFGM